MDTVSKTKTNQPPARHRGRHHNAAGRSMRYKTEIHSTRRAPHAAAKMATFNARAETIETKPFFRDAFKRTRCLIPMSGYYEWQAAPGGKQPWYFTARDGSPLLTAAGLWDEWKDRQTGERLKSCTMIITEPNDFAAEIHDRMPVFLTEQQFAPWLSGEAGAGILKPAPNDYLQRWPVSKRVNSSKADADDVTLIEDRIGRSSASYDISGSGVT